MSDPGAPSGAVAETTTTAGTEPYQLNPNPPNALAAYFRFADVYLDGASIVIEVDNTAQKEIIVSTFDRTNNTLSRDPAAVLFSSAGPLTLVNWPNTGQRTIRPLSGLTGPFYLSFSVGSGFTEVPVDDYDGNFEIFDVVAPTTITFPGGLVTSPLPGCEVAPTLGVTCPLQKIALGSTTMVGQLSISAGSVQGAYSSVAFSLSAGDRLRLYAPSDVDTNIVGLFGTIVGIRS
jgi:hypothetical protein